MRYFLMALLMTAMGAHAADRKLVWGCPTTREDGSAFSCVTDGGNYDLSITRPGVAEKFVKPGPLETSYVIQTDPAGTSYRIRLWDKGGEVSQWSASVVRPASRPSAPVLIVQ